jgi:hypothetical protein
MRFLIQISTWRPAILSHICRGFTQFLRSVKCRESRVSWSEPQKFPSTFFGESSFTSHSPGERWWKASVNKHHKAFRWSIALLKKLISVRLTNKCFEVCRTGMNTTVFTRTRQNQQMHQLFIQFINYVWYILHVSALHWHLQGAFLVPSERYSIEEQSKEFCGWACCV